VNFNGSASQLLDLELRSERIDHWIKIAHQHILQLVQRKADAMVGDAIFFEVLGANFFAPSALANLGLALRRHLFGLLVFTQLEQARTQYSHCT
jgi:hypothetical protein